VYKLGKEVNGAHELVVRREMVLGKVISKVDFPEMLNNVVFVMFALSGIKRLFHGINFHGGHPKLILMLVKAQR